MALIIDTMNVLHAWSGLRTGSVEPTVHGLARLVEGSRYGGRRVRLVCDGGPPGDWPERVELALSGSGRTTAIYAGRGRDADGLIEELLGEEAGARHTLVVSDDRRIARAARRRRARHLGSRVFLHEVLVDGRAGGVAGLSAGDPAARVRGAIPLGESAVAGWLRFFRMSENVVDSVDLNGSEGLPAGLSGKERGSVGGSGDAGTVRGSKAVAGGAGGAGSGTGGRAGGGVTGGDGPGEGLDPALARLIREAIAEGARIDAADLDMSKWLR